jgi:hypothetical protein
MRRIRPLFTALLAELKNDRDESGAERSRWSDGDVLFGHQDQKGLDLLVDAVPLSGRIVILTKEPKGELPPRRSKVGRDVWLRGVSSSGR